MAQSSAEIPFLRCGNLPSYDDKQYSSRHLLSKRVCRIWRLYIISEAIHGEKILWFIFGREVGQCDPIVMKLLFDVWHCLLDVYTKFRIDVLKHVQQVRKTFRWLGALLTSPFECFCLPEGQKLPNHDKNQMGSRHSLYTSVYQIWGIYVILRPWMQKNVFDLLLAAK